METAENLCLGFGCLGKDFFAKVSVYIYKKRVMTLVTLMTTPESPVVIGFACHHIQTFT